MTDTLGAIEAIDSIAGKTVTITGGTGSFGSTMVRHLLNHGVAQVNVLSRDQAMQDAMRRTFADERMRFFLGDVRDIDGTEPTMPRFLMSLDQSVGLVLHAFSHAMSGDLFVRKAAAATVETLARALASLMGVDDPQIAVIGSRHGEKLHETLLSVEEMVKSNDEGDYFRVPLDARSLQYELYFEEGDRRIPRDKDFTSANTGQLDLGATKELLLTVPEVRAEAEAGL